MASPSNKMNVWTLFQWTTMSFYEIYDFTSATMESGFFL